MVVIMYVDSFVIANVGGMGTVVCLFQAMAADEAFAIWVVSIHLVQDYVGLRSFIHDPRHRQNYYCRPTYQVNLTPNHFLLQTYSTIYLSSICSKNQKKLLNILQIQIYWYTTKYIKNTSRKMQKKIRIVAMSDSHDSHHNIDISSLPEADIFIHAGDFTQNSFRGEIDRFVAFLEKLPYRHKVVIAGNHDFVLDRDNYENKHKPKRHPYEKMNSLKEIEKIKKVCTYLHHEAIEIEGVKIFGSPYQPLFFNWGFQYHESRANQIWSTLPTNIDILITHGPPYGILDKTSQGHHAGCKTLAQKVQQIQPKVHIFGHVHNSYGQQTKNGVTYINAAIMSEAYQVIHPVQYIEIQI